MDTEKLIVIRQEAELMAEKINKLLTDREAIITAIKDLSDLEIAKRKEKEI